MDPSAHRIWYKALASAKSGDPTGDQDWIPAFGSCIVDYGKSSRKNKIFLNTAPLRIEFQNEVGFGRV